MKLISWGFIGCGEVTEKKSGPAFNMVEGSHVEAVMSRNADKARTYAQERGIKKWYTDAGQLIDDPDINAIYIATPPSSHATFAIMAMKAGETTCRQLRRLCPHKQGKRRDWDSMFRRILPTLFAILPESEGDCRQWCHRPLP